MSSLITSLVRAFAGLEAGPECRRCSQSISTDDRFGASERVCAPCRFASDA
jgi:hypothetical protein